MSLHPIIALDHIIEEYRDHLLTEFRARDPGLQEALEREIEKPLFLAQEPFYQAHRPFRSGQRWRELPLDPRLATVLEKRSGATCAYSHQSDAITELLRKDARPVVVTTGTGSGKTEAFLLPVLQNAIEDAAQFDKSGLTAILVYPLNALAEDQLERIKSYLEESGFGSTVRVGQYNRGTSQTEREAMRRNPPHILLTNYMMLEYLLVRPADREAIFANHRCRFLVLDEVHTYRGSLGSNIALLIRRLQTHLRRANHNWMTDPSEVNRSKRYPSLVPVGTSATIKSVSSANVSVIEARRLRDEAVRSFFGMLSGAPTASIQVVGEELQDIITPPDATCAATPPTDLTLNVNDKGSVRAVLCRLTGLPETTPLTEAARRCRLLWEMNKWLATAPRSVSQMVALVRQNIPARTATADDLVKQEVEAALVAGAALPEGTPGVLRLRAHRFIRGGWCFHRCTNPGCGRLYPMGQRECECGHRTAPLHLCRNCGADFLQLIGDPKDGQFQPGSGRSKDGESEWMLFDPRKIDPDANGEDADDQEEERDNAPKPRGKGRSAVSAAVQKRIMEGSFDSARLFFSATPNDYRQQVSLISGRQICPCCGGRAGSRKVITPVSLGTSAALKVLAEGTIDALDEAHAGESGYDGKNRLLIFSDSRQDAAHQARFIVFASRYDRMRRSLMRILKEHHSVSLQRAVELLGEAGIRDGENPYAPQDPEEVVYEERRARVQAYEEAPLLDDISVGAGYRATILNLGLAGVVYDGLNDYIASKGGPLANSLGITPAQLTYVCRCFLDAALYQGVLSREMLRYHPKHPSRPLYMLSAEWERSMAWPKGLPCDSQGNPLERLDEHDIPNGITLRNVWRQSDRGANSTFERVIRNLIAFFGGRSELNAQDAVDLMMLLKKGAYLKPDKLYGFRDTTLLLQVNHERIRLVELTEADRKRCGTCGTPRPGAETGVPCPRCHGTLRVWRDEEMNRLRTVRRILAARTMPLYAAEHTAQVPAGRRVELEREFKAESTVSKRNVLACSPTLEMGIDVGGLDAVAMRNIPPRPDNYAQRGGRAGRRSRTGLVLGYAGRTPHDQYFYDQPAEMIAGEIPAPSLALTNKDVILRHASAIALGAADPGLSGRMVDYVSTDGVLNEEKIQELANAVTAKVEHALTLTIDAFGPETLAAAGLPTEVMRAELLRLPARMRDVFERTARQVIELRQALDRFSRTLQDQDRGMRSANLVARLLGVPTEKRRGGGDQADDRSAGYPLRRFAEAGLLPGYEFPIEPSTVRLLGDLNEEEPISVARQFGIAQFQPESPIYARTKRWRVIGLDMASPWNPRSDAPGLTYRVCSNCGLRHDAQHPRCPRCAHEQLGPSFPGFAYGGFLAKRDERPVLTEEDRVSGKNSVRIYPQRNGQVIGRWALVCGWHLTLNRNETILWLNEGQTPDALELEKNAARLHDLGKGFLLCGVCGHILSIPAPESKTGKGRKKPQHGEESQFGHQQGCQRAGQTPRPIALYTEGQTETLRLTVPVPANVMPSDYQNWGLSLGYALRIGIRHLFMLDGAEIEFELEGPWVERLDGQEYRYLSLTFIDPSLGGTGYLARTANDFHLVAARTLNHLQHSGCETACYRCLKSYANQRFHENLEWPLAAPVLEALVDDKPTTVPLTATDADSPRPWLDAYAAGLGSPLELKFFKLFEQHGFTPAKQVPISVPEGAPPITIADFAVPERRLAIYVDGASVHIGHVARRDKIIRERLRNATPPWTVVELRASDLRQGKALVDRLVAHGV